MFPLGANSSKNVDLCIGPLQDAMMPDSALGNSTSTEDNPYFNGSWTFKLSMDFDMDRSSSCSPSSPSEFKNQIRAMAAG